MLGDNTDGGTVIPCEIKFQCVGIWVSSRLHFNILYSCPFVYSVPTWAKSDVCWTLRNVTVAYVGECMQAQGYPQKSEGIGN